VYLVLRLVYTHSQKSQLTLHVDSTDFHAICYNKLINNAGEVNNN